MCIDNHQFQFKKLLELIDTIVTSCLMIVAMTIFTWPETISICHILIFEEFNEFKLKENILIRIHWYYRLRINSWLKLNRFNGEKYRAPLNFGQQKNCRFYIPFVGFHLLLLLIFKLLLFFINKNLFTLNFFAQKIISYKFHFKSSVKV